MRKTSSVRFSNNNRQNKRRAIKSYGDQVVINNVILGSHKYVVSKNGEQNFEKIFAQF